jgi:hypothetical protein
MKTLFWVSLLALVLISLVLRRLVSSQDKAKRFGDFRDEIPEPSQSMHEQSQAVPARIPKRQMTWARVKERYSRRGDFYPHQRSSKRSMSQVPVGGKRSRA